MRKILPYIILVATVLLAYGQSINYYFWHDDYTVLYYAQNNTKMSFPYQSSYYLGQSLYNFFGLNPIGYHIVGIILYISASILLYILFIKIIKNKEMAYFSTLVFSAGYVGQEAMKIFVSVGFAVFLGLNTFLLTLIFLYERRLIYSLVFFFLTIELAPHRYFGIIFVVLALEWFLTNKIINLRRAFLFLSIFLFQYIAKPTRLIFNYPANLVLSDLWQQLQNAARIKSLTNFLGTFWNLFFPTYFQTEYFFYLSRNLYGFLLGKAFWFVPLPSYLFCIGVFLLLGKNSFIKIIAFGLVIYLWNFLISKTIPFSIEQISVVNGGALFLLFCFFVIKRISDNKCFFLFSIILTISMLSLVLIFNSDSILESEHRYLFPSVLIPSFFVTIFASKKKIFFLTTALLIFLRLTASIFSQNEFVQSQSKDAKKFFEVLSTKLKNAQGTLYVSIEGTTKDISFKIADAMRVGAMSSEASVAVHINKKVDSIVLIDKPEDGLNYPEHIYRFLYDGENLKDVTMDYRVQVNSTKQIIDFDLSKFEVMPADSRVANTKKSLIAKTHYVTIDSYTLGVYPRINYNFDNKIPSHLPLKISLNLKAYTDPLLPLPYAHMHYAPQFVIQPNIWSEVFAWRKGQCKQATNIGCIKEASNLDDLKTGEIEIAWEYNSYGPVGTDRSKKFRIQLDGKLQEINFDIPAGGEYLKELVIRYMDFPGFIEISKFSIQSH